MKSVPTALMAVTIGGFIATDSTVFAKVNSTIAEFCLKATDFAGCVQTMTDGQPPKEQQDGADVLRTWTRDNGTIIRFRPSSVVGLKHDGKYGRYIEYTYGLQNRFWSGMWVVQADCSDYKANWDKDDWGWYSVSDPSMFLSPGKKKWKYSSAKEAKAILDEFCPVINTLPRSEKPIK